MYEGSNFKIAITIIVITIVISRLEAKIEDI